MSEEIIKKQKYKKLPPEGGWGYLIWISMALSFVSYKIYWIRGFKEIIN